MNNVIVLATYIEGLPPPRRGKVRDIYETENFLLIVATDRISALDDEASTPDSSRFWRANAYQPSAPQESYDKQIIPELFVSAWVGSQPPSPTSAPGDHCPGRSPLPGNP